MQSYDAALVLEHALRAAKSASAPAVARALAATRIDGVGQPLGFASSGFVATDWYAWEVFNESSGAPYLATRAATLWKHAGAHSSQCKARHDRRG